MTPDDPLFKALQALPREIAPERDLWEDIRPALQPPAPAQPAAAPWWSGLLAAAAILLVAVGTGQLVPEPPPAEPAAEAGWSEQMASGMAALEETLASHRDEMEPEMWLIVDQSLGEIDDAMRRIEAAMAQRPDDPQLEVARARLRQQRVALLRTAVNL